MMTLVRGIVSEIRRVRVLGTELLIFTQPQRPQSQTQPCLSRTFLLLPLCLPLGACLQTRSDLKEQEKEKVVQEQIVQFQRSNAQNDQKLSEIESHIRDLTGKVEVLEVERDSRKKEEEKRGTEGAERMDLLQKAITELNTQVQDLKLENEKLRESFVALQSQNANSSRREARDSKDKKATNSFDQAEDLFKAKDWKNAILSYQKYRESNPKGKKSAEATFKIAESFSEMKMKEEARAFYEEVVQKFPESSFAKKSKEKLRERK